MDARTLNAFYHRLQQSSDNHKPHRHRKSQCTEDEVVAKMKLKMARRKAQEKHKRVISQARKRRGAVDETVCKYEHVVWNQKDDDM